MTTKLLLLGTGTPNIEHDRYQSGYAVIVDDSAYIIDCGGGTLQRIAEAHHKYNIDALKLSNLTQLFLTHLHPDHTAGLPDMMIAPWVEGRKDALHIYTPSAGVSLIDGIIAAYEPGIAEHRDGLAAIDHPLLIETNTMIDGVIYKDEHVTVTAFAVSHGDLEAYGLCFDTPSGRIVFSGDTKPVDAVNDYAKDCQILVHEVYSAETFKTRPPRWQAYHRNSHTSTIELANIANATRPKKLILTHQLLWGTTPEALTAEITDLYDGDIIYGRDLMVFEIADS